MVARIFRQMLLVLFGVYCIYHLFNGSNGLLAYWHIKEELAVHEITLKNLDEEKKHLTQSTQLLQNQRICKDLLEEQVRKVIQYSYPGDVLVITPYLGT